MKRRIQPTVRLLGTPTQMAEAYRLAHPLQQLWPVGHETA
jgi:hypothetical protein